MYWRLVFKKMTPKSGYTSYGIEVQKTTYFTSSTKKRDEIKNKFGERGYILVQSEFIEHDLPTGFEDREMITAPYWRPTFVPYEQVVEQLKGRLDEDVIANSESEKNVNTKRKKQCQHIFNCPEHREVCINKKGLEPINREFPTKVQALQM